MKNRLAQTALRQFGCVDIEKIRGFKRKIARNGRPKAELWPFEVSQIHSYLQSLRFFQMIVTFDSNVLSAQFFFDPSYFCEICLKNSSPLIEFPFYFFVVFQ